MRLNSLVLFTTLQCLVPPPYVNFENFPTNNVRSCQFFLLPRFCCQSYFPRPNAQFKLCFAPPPSMRFTLRDHLRYPDYQTPG